MTKNHQNVVGLTELKEILENAELADGQKTLKEDLTEVRQDLDSLSSAVDSKNAAVERELLRLHDLIADKLDRLERKFEKKLVDLK